MKKLISGILALSMLAGIGAVSYADDAATSTVSYVSPDPSWQWSGSQIAPNKGSMKIAFSGVIDSSVFEKISFVEKATGTAPAGGVHMSLADDNTAVVIAFGELKENTAYVLSYTGEGAFTKEYTTVAKALAEENFDDWTDADIALTTTNNDGDVMFVGNNQIHVKNQNSGHTISVGKEEGTNDGYVKFTPATTGNDLIVGTVLPTEMMDVKVIQEIKIKNIGREDNNTGDQLKVGGISHYGLEHSLNDGGYKYKDVFANSTNFSKDTDGYYNVLVVNDVYGTVPADSPKYTTNLQVSFYDMLGSGEYNSAVKTVTSNNKVNKVLALKQYLSDANYDMPNVKYLSYYKAGFYTLPEALTTPVYDGVNKTVSFTVNTDLDELTLNSIKVTDEALAQTLASEVTYDENTRLLTINFDGQVYYGDTVKFDLSGVKSKDAYAMKPIEIVHDNEADKSDINFTTLAVESTVPDPTIRNYYIVPNIGSVKVTFNSEIDEYVLTKLSFKDASGNAPVGGVKKSIDTDNKTAIIEFGELKVNTEYTLSFDSINDENDKSVTYKTLANKLLVEEDFDDWTAESVAISNGAFAGNSALYVENENNYSDIAIKEETDGKYLEIATKETNNTRMGAKLPDEMNNAKFVQIIKIKNNNASGQELRIGGLSHYSIGNYIYSGEKMDTVLDGFTKDTNEYYNYMTVSDFYDNNGTSSKYTITLFDLLSDKENKLVPSGSTTFNKVHSVSAFKSYANSDDTKDNVISITYYKAGLYTLPEIFSDVEYNSTNKTAVFTVNTDLDEITLANIVAENTTRGKVVTANAEYNAANRTVSVALSGSIYNGDEIVIDLSGVMSKDGFAMKDTVAVTHSNEADTFIELAVSSVQPDPTIQSLKSDGTVERTMDSIGVNQGEIKVHFNTPVDMSTTAGITFKDAEGNAPIGGIKLSADGNSLIITFGELSENATYTLTIPETVKGTNDSQLTDTKTYVYKTLPKTLINDDFSAWEIGSYKPSATGSQQLTEGKNLYLYRNNTTNDITVAEENGDKYLNVVSSSSDGDVRLGSLLGGWITEGKITSFISYKAESDATNGLNNLRIAAYARDNLGAELYSDFGITHGNIKATADSNGYRNIEMKTEIDNVTLYDSIYFSADVKNAAYENGASVANINSTRTKLQANTIGSNAFSYLRMYNVSGTIKLTSVKSGFYTEPAMFSDAVYDKATKKLSFVVNTDLDTTTLSGFKAEGAVITPAYDSATRTVTLSIDAPSGDYVVIADGVKSADGLDFTMENIAVDAKADYAVDNAAVTYDTDTVTVTGTLTKNTEESKSADLYIAIYDATSKALKTVKKISASATTPISENITVTGATDENTDVKIFVWDSNMKPYDKTIEK